MASKPRSVDIKKKADNFGYSCQNLRVDREAGEEPSFEFKNKTKFNVEINFLDQNLVVDPATGKVLPAVQLGPNRTSQPLLVNLELASGTYLYRVYLVEPDIEAEGGSRPGIEIVP